VDGLSDRDQLEFLRRHEWEAGVRRPIGLQRSTGGLLMPRFARRYLPLLAISLAAALIGTGSLASASGDHGQRRSHGAGHGRHHSCDKHCKNGRFSAWDEQWLMMSIEGDRFEIQGGQLAQQKGTTQKVRDLGSRLVKDHSKSLADAIELARKLGIEVPDSPSPSQQWELRAVAQFDGSDFDRWYADLEVQDHIQDIQEAKDEVKSGCNRKIRRDAKDEIPVLQEHLRLAQDALASVS
jgi:putative membrane protein